MTQPDLPDRPALDPDLRLDARTALPEALRVLVQAMPQASWAAHPNFGGMTQFWLERHAAFRQLLDRIAADAGASAAGDMAAEDFAPRLYRLASTLLGELHGHHSVEDAHYFPQLRRLEPSVARGFDLLDADHKDLDARLHGFAGEVNGLLQAAQAGTLGAAQMEPFVGSVAEFQRVLDRHLVDEEELVIPALLKLGG
ncbi:hemerythrin domain-containing protein [Thalassobaculum sp. OXR-137]|uniref:hemerythrin domain-containing protein n=1 Tax=Thalassobaculum sp. OXR-137 TaxID=3100173 RepID=UPI002AC9E026|nr:hemerythrin domain-containing protein [Thalassobaculum sp. OXR-137]WPZ32578.1 hemerythrin domain-containing protein [Thalassobaculum sp. OXR-137]